MIGRIGYLSVFSMICVISILAQTREIRVNLVDPAGAPVTEATVSVTSKAGQRVSCKKDEDAFVCTAAETGQVTFEITAKGFKPLKAEYAEPDVTCCEYVFVLQIETVRENVVAITRSGLTLENTPESVLTVDRAHIQSSAAPTLDDVLRQVPGFSIFRRTSGRNANPTTQGVSLRGVGASGASRSVVLFDGVPLNDPFGGWVQWNRISSLAIDEVEVLRGGASSIYGGSALSGGIELRSREPDEGAVSSAEVFGGSQRTMSASLFAGKSWNGFSADVASGHFQTRGYTPVDVAERGSVDSYAGVRSVNISPRIGRKLGELASIFFRPTYFGESRTNGTPAQINRTHSRQFVLGGVIGKPDKVRFDWRAFGGTQVYDQTFSAVTSDRSTEVLTRLQRSPSQYFGASGTINFAFRSNSLVAGVEGREVRGSSDEIGFSNGIATSLIGAGGRERTVGVFVRDYISLGDSAVISGGVRYDRWENFRGLSVTKPISTGITTVVNFDDRTEGAWSPSVALQFQATKDLSFRAAASRSFRAPTLNELYRGFRVGNVLTNANAYLEAERAANFEAGTAFRLGRFGVRASVFSIHIDRAIANVTLSSSPSLIARQRQNAGKTRTIGFEVDSELQIGHLDLRAGYIMADSSVTDFPSNPVLVDKFIPQVPRHQVTFQMRYPYTSWTFSIQGRAASEQFDDDLNQFRLEPYFQLDGFVSRRLGEKISLFVAVENVFNTRYSTARTPIRSVSSPTNARFGFRWN